MFEKLLKIKQHLNDCGISQTNAASRLGVSVAAVNSLLTGKREFGRKTASDWSREFGFNPLYLMTGEGDMLLNAENIADVDVRRLPIINFDTAGGWSNEVDDMAEFAVGTMALNSDIAHEGDFVIMVTGDSMAPKYPSGCFVLLREVEMWREYMELGICYTLLLRDGRRVIKEVRAGTDRQHVTLHSVNPNYDPVEISVEFISRVFMVVLLVRKEVM